jgi:RNA polymerase sigma factor for flagellar operon FliA
MLDGLRNNDWSPRGARREMRRVEAAIHKLEHENGRQPSESELAAALDLNLADYQKLLLEARGHQLVYLEDLADGQDSDFLERHGAIPGLDPLALLEEAGTRQVLVNAIETLPEREKMMMALYYEQDLNLREIGEVLGVTESRVCQLHSQAIARLRAAVVGEGKPVSKSRRGAKPPPPTKT